MLSTTRRGIVTLAGLAAAAVAWAAPAGSVNLPLRGRDKVLGTIRPASDLERFLCDIPRGAALSVSVKGKTRGGPPFVLDLQESGTPVPGAMFETRGTGQVLDQPFTVPASGRYTVRVQGDFEHDGDYELKVAWKPKTVWTEVDGPLSAASTTTFAFAASAGANATIDVRPAARSAFRGEIVGVDGPSGPLTVPPGTTSRLVLQRLPATGEYVVTFRNAGADAGDWAAKATVKPPKTRASNIDIRDGRLTGAFGGDHTVYGSVIGAAGGTLEVTGTFGPLDGTSVTVPGGSLSSPTILTVSAASPLGLPAGISGAGPAVDLGPSGTVFDPTGTNTALQAIVTIPFDPAYFPSGTDSLVIYVRSSSGELSEVPGPYTFGANTVTFATAHFSAFQAATTGPRALSGDFVTLELNGEANSQYGGRWIFTSHRLTADGNGAGIAGDALSVVWTDFGQQGSTATLNQSFNDISFTVTVEDDQHVTLTNTKDPKDVTRFRRGASDDVLVAEEDNVVLLRRAAGQPTVTTIAGRWHLFHLGLETRNAGAQPPVLNLGPTGASATVTLATDGTVSFSGVKSAASNTNFPTGTWTIEDVDGAPAGVTWDILDGSVRLLIPDFGFPVSMTAALGGDVLVGRGSSPNGDGDPNAGPWAEQFVLVRASSGAALADAAGQYFIVGSQFETVNASQGPGQGFEFRTQTLTGTLTKTGALSGVGTADVQSHDAQGEPFRIDNQTVDGGAGKLTLRPDGFFSSTDGARGAFSRRGDLLVRFVANGADYSIDVGTPLVENPRKANQR
jgi:hypothetical protein